MYIDEIIAPLIQMEIPFSSIQGVSCVTTKSTFSSSNTTTESRQRREYHSPSRDNSRESASSIIVHSDCSCWGRRKQRLWPRHLLGSCKNNFSFRRYVANSLVIQSDLRACNWWVPVPVHSVLRNDRGRRLGNQIINLLSFCGLSTRAVS